MSEVNTAMPVLQVTAPEAAKTRKSSFSGDALRVTLGASSAQLFSIAAAPLLTRMYAPETFGLMSLYTSLVGVGTVIAACRYDQAIMLPADDEDAANVVAVALSAVVCVATIFFLALLLFRAPISSLLSVSRLGGWAYFIPVSMLVGAAYQISSSWNARKRAFTVVSTTRTSASAVSNSLQLSAGYFGFTSVGGLIAPSIIGIFAGFVISATAALRRFAAVGLPKISRKKMAWAIVRYREFPLYNSWGVFLNTLSWQIPIILLTRYFGPRPAGYFGLGMRVLSIPMDVIALSIGQVLFQRAAASRASGTLPETVEAAVSRLIAFGILPVLVLGGVAPQLFGMVFGPAWKEAGAYVEILSPWMCVWFMSSPISVLFNVLERQKFGLMVNITIFVTRVLSLYAGGLAHQPRVAVALFSATGVLVYGWLCISLIRASGARLGKLMGLAGKRIALAAFIFAVIYAQRRAGLPDLVVVGTGALALSAYLWWQAMCDQTIAAQVRGVLARFSNKG